LFLNLIFSSVQTAWIPYMTELVYIGKKGTQDAPVFWTLLDGTGAETSYEMTNTDVKFVASMGYVSSTVLQ